MLGRVPILRIAATCGCSTVPHHRRKNRFWVSTVLWEPTGSRKEVRTHAQPIGKCLIAISYPHSLPHSPLRIPVRAIPFRLQLLSPTAPTAALLLFVGWRGFSALFSDDDSGGSNSSGQRASRVRRCAQRRVGETLAACTRESSSAAGVANVLLQHRERGVGDEQRVEQ